jgi:fructose-1-phosphate kinase PfkB-like protein
MALCFSGGSTGADCLAWLGTKGIAHQGFSTAAATRIGTVVRGGGQAETTFLGPDAVPDANAWATCAAYIEALPDNHVLALCGSFPGWSTPAAAPLRAALAHWATRGILVADTYGPPLDWALQQPLALVKINRDEFDALNPLPASAEPFATRLATALVRSRIQAWIVTDGSEPVWYADRSNAPIQLVPPVVSLVSPTGSGDVLLACLLHGHFQRGQSLSEALAYALPYAAANASHPGIADFDLNNLPI